MRSTFFSSVAHELRTPLNSILPILRMILDILSATTIESRVSGLINIVLNSALHLESLIEDALDMSRIENNQFKLNMESFDFSSVVKEVADIMKF